MKRNWLTLALSLLLILAFLISGSAVLAQDEGDGPAPVGTAITITSKPDEDRFGNEFTLISARLTTVDGVPVGNETVVFSKIEDFFGLNSVRIGTATTNAVGIASIQYETARMGEHQIQAVFGGDAGVGYTGSQATSTIDVSIIQPIEYEPLALLPVQSATMAAVGFVVLAVWALLVFVLLKIFIGIRRSADLKA